MKKIQHLHIYEKKTDEYVKYEEYLNQYLTEKNITLKKEKRTTLLLYISIHSDEISQFYITFFQNNNNYNLLFERRYVIISKKGYIVKCYDKYYITKKNGKYYYVKNIKNNKQTVTLLRADILSQIKQIPIGDNSHKYKAAKIFINQSKDIKIGKNLLKNNFLHVILLNGKKEQSTKFNFNKKSKLTNNPIVIENNIKKAIINIKKDTLSLLPRQYIYNINPVFEVITISAIKKYKVNNIKDILKCYFKINNYKIALVLYVLEEQFKSAFYIKFFRHFPLSLFTNLNYLKTFLRNDLKSKYNTKCNIIDVPESSFLYNFIKEESEPYFQKILYNICSAFLKYNKKIDIKWSIDKLIEEYRNLCYLFANSIINIEIKTPVTDNAYINNIFKDEKTYNNIINNIHEYISKKNAKDLKLLSLVEKIVTRYIFDNLPSLYNVEKESDNSILAFVYKNVIIPYKIIEIIKYTDNHNNIIKEFFKLEQIETFYEEILENNYNEFYTIVKSEEKVSNISAIIKKIMTEYNHYINNYEIIASYMLDIEEKTIKKEIIKI